MNSFSEKITFKSCCKFALAIVGNSNNWKSNTHVCGLVTELYKRFGRGSFQARGIEQQLHEHNLVEVAPTDAPKTDNYVLSSQAIKYAESILVEENPFVKPDSWNTKRVPLDLLYMKFVELFAHRQFQLGDLRDFLKERTDKNVRFRNTAQEVINKLLEHGAVRRINLFSIVYEVTPAAIADYESRPPQTGGLPSLPE